MCLNLNDHVNDKCRVEAQQYFQCRMENGLMAKEDWDKLGYTSTEPALSADDTADKQTNKQWP